MQFAPYFLYKCIKLPFLGPGPHAPGCPVWWIRSSVSPDLCTKQGKGLKQTSRRCVEPNLGLWPLAVSTALLHGISCSSTALPAACWVSSAQRGPSLSGAMKQSENLSYYIWWLEWFHMFSQFSPGPQRSAGHSLGEQLPALEHHCSDVSRAHSTPGAPPALRLGPSRVWGFLTSLWHRAGVAWAVRAARPLAAFTRRSGLGLGVSSRPGEGLSWRWPLPWDKRVYLGGVVLFCIHNCGLVSDPLQLECHRDVI